MITLKRGGLTYVITQEDQQRILELALANGGNLLAAIEQQFWEKFREPLHAVARINAADIPRVEDSSMIQQDTSNKHMVGAQGQMIRIMGLSAPITLGKNDALNLAAWIVALADPLDQEFPELLREIKKD